MSTRTTKQPQQNAPKFIAIEGPLGGGKTELAQRLAETFSYCSLLENISKNPFIDAFFKHKSSNALANHLYFLFQRAQLTEHFGQAAFYKSTHITDFIIEKDHFLAKALLPPEEFEIYDKVYQLTAIEMPKPDLVIYLQTPTSVIQNHLENHPLANLESINPHFLEQVNDAYRHFFHYYDAAPLLIVDAANVNLVDDKAAFNALVEYTTDIQPGRYYFNPSFIGKVSP